MFKSRLRRFTAAALALAFVAAATPNPAVAARVASWSRVEIRLVNGQTGEAMLVAGQLSGTGQLPAAVKLSAPTGTKLDWAGQILGGDVAKDPAVQYTTVQKPGYDEIGFTLTQAPRGQIEFTLPDALSTSGANKTATLNWTSPVDVPEVIVAIEVPANAKIVSSGDGQAVSAGGASFYQKTLKSVKAGQKITYQVTYSGGTVAPATGGTAQPQGIGTGTGAIPTGATSSGRGNSLPTMLIVLGALLGLGYFGIKAVSPKGPVAEEEAAAPRERQTTPPPIRKPSDFDAFGDEDDAVEPEREPVPKSRKRA